jgi:hypothetical protein
MDAAPKDFIIFLGSKYSLLGIAKLNHAEE